MQLDELVAQLQRAIGSSMVGIVLYGSAASDEHVHGHSDHNVLVIVETLPVDTMRTLGQTVRAWSEAGNPPPLLFTRAEWQGSADVFPMEYADVLERHRVLAGTLPLQGIEVRTSDLRLQTEQEALGKLLRLRRAVITAGTEVARQRELLRASLSAFLVIMRSVLRLNDVLPPRDAGEVIARTASLANFDAAPFARVQAMIRGSTLADGDVDGVTRAYVDGAERLVRYLDQLQS